MGFELLNLPYAFMQPYGATVGYQSTQGTVCGSLAHSDEQGNLLWFNGGLAVDKGSRADEIYDFKYWATDMGKIGEWTWEAGHLEKLCWTSQDPETQVKMMSSGQKRLIEKYVEFYKLSRKNLNY